MARRVNTKFVIILGGSLLCVGMVLTGTMVYRMLRNRDPVWLEAQGKAAEKAGNVDGAILNYVKAADVLSRKHLPGSDGLYVRAADLSMNSSKNAKTEEDAILYYQKAMQSYLRAQTDNPRNKEVNRTLLEESFQDGFWNAVEEQATKMISVEDGAKPRAYRAQARLLKAIVKSGNDQTLRSANDADFKPIDEDLAAALKFDPSSGLATALSVQLQLVRARLVAAQAGLSEGSRDQNLLSLEAQRSVQAARLAAAGATTHPESAATQPQKTEALLKAIEAAGPYVDEIEKARVRLDEFLDKHGMDPDVALTRVNMSRQQYVIFQSNEIFGNFETQAMIDLLDKTGKKELVTAVGILQKTLEKDPSNTRIGDALGQFYDVTDPEHPEKIEALYKTMIEAGPDVLANHMMLAGYYRGRNNPAAAIDAYKTMLTRKRLGSGGETLRNAKLRFNAIEQIAWLDMDLASSSEAGMGTDKGKAYMKEAGEFVDKLRSHVSRGRVYLLDGRVQLMNRNVADAILTLQQAQANLNGDPEGQYQLRQAKILLATANEMQGSAGPAVTLLKDALDMQPNDQQLRLRLGRLLAQAGSLVEAQKAMESPFLLGDPKRNKDGAFTGTFTNESNLSPQARDQAKRIWAGAMATLGNTKDAETVLKMLAALPEDKGSIMQWMLTELSSGENEGAYVDAMSVLEKAANNKPEVNVLAYQVAVTAKSRAGDKDEARKLAAAALAMYPDNTTLQFLKEQANSPDGKIKDDVQVKILEAIPDELTRLNQLAQFYHDKDSDKEISNLQEMEKKLNEKGASLENRDTLNSVIDRIFSAAIIAAVRADAAAAPAYWKMAQTYVMQAEKMNLDGVGGKLYRGRMELAKTNGQNGIQQVLATVAQRPDYAFGHLMLGQAYLAQRNQVAALEEFRKVIQLSPSNIQAMQAAIQLLVPRGDVAAADPSNLREAQNYVSAGLLIAPHNQLFEDFHDILLTSPVDVDQAIRRRELTYARDPGNVRNIRWLAALYQRQWSEQSPEKKRTTPNQAVELLRKEVANHKDNLELADNLARVLLDSNQPEDVAKLYAPFIASPDANVRFDALLSSAEFDRRAGLTDEAVKALEEAIKIQPPGVDEAQRHLADMYFELGGDENMVKAEKSYEQVVDGLKDVDARDKVLRRLIETQLRQRKFDQALPQLDALLVRADDNFKQHADLPDAKRDLVQGITLRAFASIQQNKLQAALTDLDRALKLDDGNPDALYYRAVVRAAMCDQAVAQWKFAEARSAMDAAVTDLLASQARDRTPNSRLLLAQIYRRTQRYSEASIVYSGILDKWPDRLDVRVEYSDFLMNVAAEFLSQPAGSHEDLVRMLRELSPVDKLFEQLRDAQVRFPRQLRWPLMFADLLTLRGNDAEAYAYYKQLFSNMPGEAQICDAYLGALVKNKAYDEAVKLVTTLTDQNAAFPDFVKKNPKFVAFYIKRAEAYQGLNKNAEAVQDFDRAFKVAVDEIGVGGPGTFIEVLGEASRILTPEGAAKVLQERLKVNPNELISQIGLIQMQLLLNKPDEALKVVDAIKLPAEAGPRILALREMALARYQAKQYDAADKDFKELLSLSSDDVESLNNYAFMLADGKGQPKQGIIFADRALQVLTLKSDVSRISMRSASVYDTLGWAKYLDGRSDDAIADLQKAVNLQAMAASYLHLATVYQKANKLSDAKHAVEEGMKLEKAAPDDSKAGLEKLESQLR